MAAAANYAWVNRATMTFLTRRAFAKQFGKTAKDLDMHVVYDVSHNIAKVSFCHMVFEQREFFVHALELVYCSICHVAVVIVLYLVLYLVLYCT